MKPRTPHIAIVSTLEKTYSETFVHQHITGLPFGIHHLYGGNLPAKYTELLHEKRGEFTADKERIHYDISSYLRKQNIALVLAEFGPVGAEMTPICRQAGIPLIVHFHGYGAWRKDVLKHYQPLYSEMFDYASSIVAVSVQMVAQLVRLGCPPKKIKLLPYGVDTTFFEPGNVAKQTDFIACGRFVEKKGHLHTLRAFSKVLQKENSATLLLIGDGPELNSCKAFAGQNEMENNVHFGGVRSHKEVRNALQKSKVFVQHSVTARNGDAEGTPLVVLEAAACGLPVVATAHQGICEAVVHGSTGFLTAEQDDEKMATYMLELLRNKELVKTMGKAGRVHIAGHYRDKDYLDKLATLIAQNIR